MNIKTIIATLVAAAAGSTLVGCGGTPGNAEVREGLRNRVISVNEQITRKKPTAEELKQIDVELEKVKVVACQKADPMNGFNCDWTGGEKFVMFTGGSRRFLKTDAGWMLMTAGQ